MMNFCPQCNTLLHTVMEDGSMQQRCTNCSYKDTINKGRVIKATTYNSTGIKLNPSMIYDEGLRRTSRVRCVRSDCDSNDPSKLGQIRSDGMRIQTDILLTSHTSEERVITYICRLCGCAFGPAHIRRPTDSPAPAAKGVEEEQRET